MNAETATQDMAEQIALTTALEELSADTMNELSVKIHAVARSYRSFFVWGPELVNGKARIQIFAWSSLKPADVLHTVWLARPPLARG